MGLDQEPSIWDIYLQFTEEELKEAEANLERQIEIGLRITIGFILWNEGKMMNSLLRIALVLAVLGVFAMWTPGAPEVKKLPDGARAEGKLRGMTADQIVLNVDIAPTIIELAGLKVSERIQGRSLLPLLRNEEPEWRSDFLCEHFFQSRKHRIPPSEGVRTERWKYIRYFGQQPVYEELYDLQNDPMETVNPLGDPQYAVELKQLRKRCDALIKEIK